MTNPDTHAMPADAGFSNVGAAASGIVGAVAPALVNAALGSYQSKKNYEAQMRAMKDQQAFELMMWNMQNDYNTPFAQRKRMEEAGYNPNLFYGQGNSGNASSAPQTVQRPSRDFSFMSSILPLAMQSMVQLQSINESRARTDRSVAQTELAQVQTSVAQANPHLNKDAFDAIVSSFKSTAMIKSNEATRSFYDTQVLTQGRPQDRAGMTVGQQIILRELDLLDQKYELGSKDLKIKAEIFNSKEFQNDILEIQSKFLKSGDVTPGQILQFIQMLILKAM